MEQSLKKLRITQPRIELLSTMGIDTIEDLITYYPYRYEFMEKHLPTLDDLTLVADGIISSNARIAYHRNKQSKMIFQMIIDNKMYDVSIFNRHFMQAKLKAGTEVTITGKMSGTKNIICSDIKFGLLSSQNPITPVYSCKEGITSKSVWGYVKKGLDYVYKDIVDFVPEAYKEKYRLVDKKDALYKIHFPSEKNDIKHALRHLKYEEFLKFQLMMIYSNKHTNHLGLSKKIDKKKVNDFILTLPFRLTPDQNNAVNEILKDLESEQLMNRLVQGDVGSGKTIVAIISMYATYLSGYQSAMMAPTEILAKQHYKNLCNYFKNENVNVELLIGSTTAKEKERIYQGLMDGSIDMIVGTHALIQDKVQFKKLGLVIADEQHRFGVKQRQQLKTKGDNVDLLLMTATPIPRTLAISLFGDMKVSNIKSMPSGRKEVITKYYKGKSMKPILPFLKEYLASGGQTYVVCPLVDESEGLEARDAMGIYEAMSQYFKGKYNVGLLHGRMKDDKKEEIMEEFRQNKIQILVSTTVIEVGVDVSNANMMVIYSADRFGLSQLHQLRGRVGRGTQQGYCFLFTDSTNPTSIERVSYLEKSTDGFEISEFDLKMRGPGEVLGHRQSGLPTFTIANIFEDYRILEVARNDAKEIYEKIDYYPDIALYLLENLKKLQEA